MNAQTIPPINTHYAITPEQIAFFQENGFIKLKNVFSPEEIAYWEPIISQAVAQYNTMTKPMHERSTYEKAFQQIHNLWRKDDKVREFSFSKRLAKIATELLGVSGVRMYHDQALYKEPQGGATPWHVDQYYWPVDTFNTVTAWIPLQDTPMEMGPLAFSCGSHKIKVAHDIEISDQSEEVIRETIRVKDLPVVDTPFDLGEVSFHYGWTLHRAGANLTDRMRAVMTVIYIEDGTKMFAPKNKDQINDMNWWMPGTKPGEVIQTELNPIVYRVNDPE
ncbi:phytanoyl-CoA dioxygenase family protein [Kamptonema cortianum]|uniref:Phytanoyl-CoA dioxygenase family protein n=1 Tax=Geitlerinema calcuttense NRMC-F 0142 TaxID=2922238 RepID=A0ABT7LY46_9CYAN|nr:MULTISPECIES: phytanoyl-CoA dioxygenase family protein [Cyanophyceae]MDK3157514.1 phytanoyl-CoA dioxygenase family protein [Kamptonema cortianum]MDL5052623.1 phytanoyl-CoA dioxygenase family protein [Oscillatoria laete-virens NRMC-F 0139]MDL5056928.1 phytanoyl-CoA dioxygenase family protein [Geitlerinema calcuttense NRMC-F 0142]